MKQIDRGWKFPVDQLSQTVALAGVGSCDGVFRT